MKKFEAGQQYVETFNRARFSNPAKITCARRTDKFFFFNDGTRTKIYHNSTQDSEFIRFNGMLFYA